MTTCVAVGCINGRRRNSISTVTFHRFPFHDPSLLAQWVSAVCRDSWSPTELSCLCSDHFTLKDYQRLKPGILKTNAVPSEFKRLMSTRLKKAEKPNDNEISEAMKLKSNSIQQSKNILEKDDLECRNIEKQSRKSLLVKRKLVGSVNEVNETFSTKQSKDIQSLKLQKINTVTSKFRVANVVINSLPVKTASTISGNEHSVTESDPEIISVTASEKKLTKPIKLPRKILKLSPNESEDKFQVHLSDWRPTATDSGEILAAVRVEMDESELSDDDDDDDEQSEAIFEKWMRKKMERRTMNKNSSVTHPPVFSKEDDSIARQNTSLFPMPEDVNPASGVNENRTHPKFINRIGQCVPEVDDDVPLTKSKLRFIIEALNSQHNRVQALQKSCRELSRSNAALRDALKILPSNSDNEMMETDGPAPAYLIVGSHPSGSQPSYRFTVTDCPPATIPEAIV